MMAKVTIVWRSLPGVIVAVLGAAEVDVADVDDLPVLLVAGVVVLVCRRSRRGCCAAPRPAAAPGSPPGRCRAAA